MTVETLAFPFELTELKAASSGWEFSGYCSTFGNTDEVGDVVMRGAFDATLAKRKSRPLLWQHDVREPIGVEVSLKPDDKGLFGTWSLIDTQRGTDAHKLLKAGAITTMSIGYLPEQVEFDDVGIRKLLVIDLLESSVVSIPANERAVVTRVKADLPFVQMLERAIEHLRLGTEEAKALQTRRASEKRELTEAQVAALSALSAEAKALQLALEELLTAPTAEVPGDLKLRLQLARLLAEKRGHLEEVA